MSGVRKIERNNLFAGRDAIRNAVLAAATAMLLMAPAARAQETGTPPATIETPAAPAIVTEPAAPVVVPPAADAPASTATPPAAVDGGGSDVDIPPANAGDPSFAQEAPAATMPAATEDGAPEEPPASGVAVPDGGRVGGETPADTAAPPAPDVASPAGPAAGAEPAPPAGVDASDAAPVEPAPSLLDDPAGALSHMLSPARRDANLPHDLSPWGMFMAADLVVKAVMIGLAFASLVTWTVWLAKSLELLGAKARLRSSLKAITAADSLADVGRALGRRSDPGTLLVRAAEHEMRRSVGALDHAGGQGLLQRITSHLSRIEAQAGRRMTRGTGVLATIGSTAPFVGLFGTVWGIMNSFIGISEAQTTNLAVVAPGIAEALLATALGLVAAIPAVVIYNVFARSITGYRQLLADTSAAVERLVSRDLDYRKVPVTTPARAQAAE